MDNSRKTYDDYKYVLQDTGTVSFGAKYSYREMIHDEEVPFKFKTIIERYLCKDLDPDTTLASHLYYMEQDNFAYECYLQLKAKVKINVMTEKKCLFGKKKKVYTTQVLSLKDFTQKDTLWKQQNSVYIQELTIAKLALMTFTA